MINRLKKRGKLNRFDKFNSNFYQKIQNGYLTLAKKNKSKYLLVNSNIEIGKNKDLIIKKINELIK